MIKYFVTVIALLLVLALPAQAQITVTNTFVAGDAIYAAQVNTNFNDLASNALNRTGGTITGNITVSSAITIDGIDIGAVLGGTGTPTFTSVTYTTFLKSTTALATPSALTATQATAFASTVSGAAIMGFGTTNDVSLMNRAGTVVLGIGPNTTAANFTGAVTAAGLLTINGTGSANIATFTSATNNSPYLTWLTDGTERLRLTWSSAAITLTPTGNPLTVAGVLAVSGFGTHSFSAGGTGFQELSVRNTTAGTGNGTALYLGNDASIYNFQAYSFSSTYTTNGRNVANGVTLEAQNAGGLSIAAINASGAIRFYSGGSTERMRLETTGRLSIGDVPTFVDGILSLTGNLSSNNLFAIKATTNGVGGSMILFENAAGTVIGHITMATTTTTAYNTSSDMRIKRSHGRYTDVNALRQIVVHDAEFLENGSRFPMVFAQESYQWMPEVVTVGSAGEDMSRIWAVDYGKFTPRLIVGWQQHDATITQLAARIAALEGKQ